MKVEVDKIKVSNDRQRKDMGSIEEMANSLKRFGQLQNIVIDQDYNLIIGERRTRAAILLGWTHIDAKFKHQITELEMEEMELEENIQRKALTWAEECDAKARIHEIKQKIHGGKNEQGRPGRGETGWTLRDTAAMLNESLGGVSQDIQLSNIMKALPELRNEPTKNAAVRKMKVMQERLILNELARRAAVNNKAGGDIVQLLNISAIDYLKSLPDESIDLLLTDPPYSVNIDQMGGLGWIWNKTIDEVFNDRSEKAEKLKEIRFGVWQGASGYPEFLQIIPDLARVLKEGSHCFIFCGIENFSVYADELMKVGFTVRSRPLIWVKNLQTFTSFFWKFSGKYEIILAAHKGQTGRVLNSSATDILEYAAPRSRIHPTEKPVDLLEFLINISTSEGDTVLDPFGGSGSTLRACRLTKRKGLSCEIDAEMVKKAQGLLFVDANTKK